METISVPRKPYQELGDQRRWEEKEAGSRDRTRGRSQPRDRPCRGCLEVSPWSQVWRGHGRGKLVVTRWRQEALVSVSTTS